MIWRDGHLVSEGPGGVYGERMLQGFRVWDPKRSKLAALYHLGTEMELRSDHRVLYLGAANGTTVSHVADYVEVVYAVEIAPRPMQDLLVIAGSRKNIIPILADAGRPETYLPLVEDVDLIYQDVASPRQVSILIGNLCFLKEKGLAVLMLKPRSIDVTRDPGDVFSEAEREIGAGGLSILDQVSMNPYYPDHRAFLCRKE
ncbi:MAG: fibrillarin-like rRNA/tRNA 2'-O-methyltransferase [Methanomicrobiales archaeon]|nr:fibrillarin-like rRNA/tRNA 2'-O-methyltransferase [Methanomicrobiales archaeon]NYT21372.1 fibrillarin-like rRNA/tRNA 2'-O-methyltransferase [Methanomicrobiales archaeon]